MTVKQLGKGLERASDGASNWGRTPSARSSQHERRGNARRTGARRARAGARGRDPWRGGEPSSRCGGARPPTARPLAAERAAPPSTPRPGCASCCATAPRGRGAPRSALFRKYIPNIDPGPKLADEAYEAVVAYELAADAGADGGESDDEHVADATRLVGAALYRPWIGERVDVKTLLGHAPRAPLAAAAKTKGAQGPIATTTTPTVTAFAELALLAVAAGQRARGIGARLVDEMGRALRARGCRAVLTFADDSSAFGFFSYMSFTRAIFTPPEHFQGRIGHFDGATLVELRLDVAPATGRTSASGRPPRRSRAAAPAPRPAPAPRRRRTTCTTGRKNCYCRSGRLARCCASAARRANRARGVLLGLGRGREARLAACSVSHVLNGHPRTRAVTGFDTRLRCLSQPAAHARSCTSTRKRARRSARTRAQSRPRARSDSPTRRSGRSRRARSRTRTASSSDGRRRACKRATCARATAAARRSCSATARMEGAMTPTQLADCRPCLRATGFATSAPPTRPAAAHSRRPQPRAAAPATELEPARRRAPKRPPPAAPAARATRAARVVGTRFFDDEWASEEAPEFEVCRGGEKS